MGISKSDRKDAYIELWVRDPRWTMTVPLAILAFGSIFVGYWGKEVLVSNILPPILGDEVKRVPLLFSLLGALHPEPQLVNPECSKIGALGLSKN